MHCLALHRFDELLAVLHTAGRLEGHEPQCVVPVVKHRYELLIEVVARNVVEEEISLAVERCLEERLFRDVADRQVEDLDHLLVELLLLADLELTEVLLRVKLEALLARELCVLLRFGNVVREVRDLSRCVADVERSDGGESLCAFLTGKRRRGCRGASQLWK